MEETDKIVEGFVFFDLKGNVTEVKFIPIIISLFK